MPGGLLQLVVKGKMDEFINENPEINFYKFAYKRHVNFAMENFRCDFENKPEINVINNVQSSVYRCEIKRHGNYLTNLYLRYTLPDIYSNDTYKFKWIENVGCLIIKKASINISSTEIDTLNGEYLIINNELTLPVKDSFNNLTGNVSSLTSVPLLPIPVMKINNNTLYSSVYPSANKNINGAAPSIKGREIIIPLNFNFTKHPSLAIQFSRLLNADMPTYVYLEFENFENLYQVYSNDLQMYISPSYYNELYGTSIKFNDFIKQNHDLNMYIDTNQVLLDQLVLKEIILNEPITTVVVEKLYIGNNYRGIVARDNHTSKIDINVNYHVKEIIWTLKRSDYYKFNTPTNYTNLIPEDKEKGGIMKYGVINWKDLSTSYTRIENDANYYNIIQPYQHHSCIPKMGIYSYSFSIYPEKWIPTGSYNNSQITTELFITVNEGSNEDINKKLIAMNKTPYNYEYELQFYIKTINIIEYNSGRAGLKYA
jgi:Large eukaryotic DNA virus major capsid protein/Major capsid protein N-terminus